MGTLTKAFLTVALVFGAAAIPLDDGGIISPAAAQQSTWWQGRFVNAGSTSCDDNDSVIIVSSDEVRFWESSCEIEQQVELRDMRGILLDLRSCWAEGELQDDDRLLILELTSGNVLRYSGHNENAVEMQRCSE